MTSGLGLKLLCWRLLLALIVTGTAAPAFAQAYPTRPVRIVVPYVAGGSVDSIARVLAAALSDGMGQPVIVENRAGAGGNLGADVVAKSAPDGYTMLLAAAGQAVSASLYKRLPFDPVKDFIPVSQVIESNFVLLSSPKVPAKTVAELISLAKAKPGGMNFGSSGAGSSLHLSMEIFKHAAGINVVHIPYQGDAPLYAALIADQIQMAIAPLSTATAQAKGGTIRALAVTGSRRSRMLPDVPTFVESGIKELASPSWQGLFVPAKTPPAIVLKIQQEVAKAVRIPAVADRIRALGASEPVGGTSAEFEVLFKADVDQYARIIREAGIPQVD